MAYAQPAEAGAFEDLFGYSEVEQHNLGAFPQWSEVLTRENNVAVAAECIAEPKSTRCHVTRWWDFLQSLQGKTQREQLKAVNRFVNDQDYVGDKTNYGRDDYWALPGQLMANGGDCEDFAIMKFFSLRKLGWPAEALRLVVVQDTKLRQQHAVLAVDAGQDVLILDNQSKLIQSQNNIPHYAPVVSMSDEQWWLHLPDAGLIAANR